MWQRLCFRCRRLLEKKKPDDIVVCPHCGWIWR